jgi:hypothetical protein
MVTWLPKKAWTRKGPVSVSARIRQRKSKKVRVARKGSTVASK